MATSFVKQEGVHPEGNHRYGIFDITLDNSYPSGGYTITPSTYGFQTISEVVSSMVAEDGSGNYYVSMYNPATAKLQMIEIVSGALGDTPNGTNLSTVTVRVYIHGN